ncbi:MAG: hypothetical protein R3D00_28675 [Bacteroidia bacterium]
MKNLIVLTFVILSAFMSLHAQNIAGTYTMKFKGKEVFLDRTPVENAIAGSTTFTIAQTGDEITVTMSGFQSEWSAHIMKGRVGNNRFVAVLANSNKSVYMIQGTVNGNTLSGNYAYVRYGDSSSGIVPGWHNIDYIATK